MAILTTFGFTVTGIVVPGLMLDGRIGDAVFSVTNCVFGLVDGCREVNKPQFHPGVDVMIQFSAIFGN
jgi:hypothetical protein